jgi:hypothetical protein
VQNTFINLTAVLYNWALPDDGPVRPKHVQADVLNMAIVIKLCEFVGWDFNARNGECKKENVAVNSESFFFSWCS